MNYTDPEQRDRLAAEYALGTMRGPARQRFERLLSGNADLRDLAQDWELRVNLLAESAPAVEPPAHVWEGIARRVGPASAPASLPETRRNWLWDSLGFWRGAAALAGRGRGLGLLRGAAAAGPGAGADCSTRPAAHRDRDQVGRRRRDPTRDRRARAAARTDRGRNPGPGGRR